MDIWVQLGAIMTRAAVSILLYVVWWMYIHTFLVGIGTGGIAVS